jgi:hypothetical protein
MLPPALTAAEEQKVLVTLPALDTNRLRQEDEAAAASDKSAPFRIGVVRPASIVVSERGLARQDMAPGQQLRTVVIESPGAFGIRLCVSAGQGAATWRCVDRIAFRCLGRGIAGGTQRHLHSSPIHS